MPTSRLIWRFFLPCALLLVLTAAATGWFAAGRIQQLREEDGLHLLRSKALLLAEIARPSFSGPVDPSLHARVRDLGTRGL